MTSRLTVIFYIILCLEIGIVLMLLPWVGHWFGLSDWGDNYLLLYAARKTGIHALQTAVASGWVRGAVTGLGVLNLLIAFWEIAHFRQSVRLLQGQTSGMADGRVADAHPTAVADPLSDYRRHHDARQ